MAIRKQRKTLEDWEISLIKAMLLQKKYSDQDIHAYFTRPARSINHARILEIRKGVKFNTIPTASVEELDTFLFNWPNIDPETGLSIFNDELLIKAREAMIAAVHTFNGAGLTFRAELFIVTSIIAWTYLMHAWFKHEGIDYTYREASGVAKKTKQGADKYWELGKCLRHARCPIPQGAVQNLNFILELRHEIEHRSTNRIDDAISAKLQACCLNFNEAIKCLFGPKHGLEQRLPIALQFLTFSADQLLAIKKGSGLPSHIVALIDNFEQRLTEEQYTDPAYRYRVAFVPITSNRISSADTAIEFVKADSDNGREINRILLQPVEKPRYRSKPICDMMKAEGFPKFNSRAHTELWKSIDGKNPAHGYGTKGDYKNTWVWYDKWLDYVREHCSNNREIYSMPTTGTIK